MTKLKGIGQAMEVLRPPLPGRLPMEFSGGDEFVVLLHGLWRSEAAMAPLARRLSQEKFHVLNIPYPSFRASLEPLLESLESRILKSAQGRPVHFVTHSLGGVIARHLLERDSFSEFSRLLMLAPPNQGSAIIDYLQQSPLIRVLGPMGESLHPDRVLNSLPDCCPSNTETLVVAGTEAKIPFFKRQVGQNSDGIVSVAETKLAGAETRLLRVDHTLITAHPTVMQKAGPFLRGEGWAD